MVLAPCETVADELRRQGIRRVAIWSRGVDGTLFSPSRRSDASRAQAGVDDDRPLLLFVGRLVRETTEAFGNVVVEAMSSGVPCVVTERGGPAELVGHGAHGIVVRANRPAELAAAVHTLLTRPDLRRDIGRSALVAAGAREWNAVHDRLLGTYAALAAGAIPLARAA